MSLGDDLDVYQDNNEGDVCPVCLDEDCFICEGCGTWNCQCFCEHNKV